jgi:hypothetical protein
MAANKICWLQMKRHNDHFWSIADHLDKDSLLDGLSFSLKIADEIERIGEFNKVMDVIIEASMNNKMMTTVVFKSYKTLATWIVYCASHQTAEVCFPVLKKYGAALRPEDTSFLALQDLGAIAAAHSVRKFLKQRDFSQRPFRDSDSTLSLALEVANSILSMMETFGEESELANRFWPS